MTHLENGSLIFLTSAGFLYKIIPGQGINQALVQPLTWLHPDGSTYAPSLFTLTPDRIGGLVKTSNQYEWVEFQLSTYNSTVFEFPIPPSIKTIDDLLLYGSVTEDQFGGYYVVGKKYGTPIMLRISRSHLLPKR